VPPAPPRGAPWGLPDLTAGLRLRGLFGDDGAAASDAPFAEGGAPSPGLAALDAALVAELGGARAAAQALLKRLEQEIWCAHATLGRAWAAAKLSESAPLTRMLFLASLTPIRFVAGAR
jgi:hypothetical protein